MHAAQGYSRAARDIVLKFMLKHPEQLQEPAPHLKVAAVVEAFACH